MIRRNSPNGDTCYADLHLGLSINKALWTRIHAALQPTEHILPQTKQQKASPHELVEFVTELLWWNSLTSLSAHHSAVWHRVPFAGKQLVPRVWCCKGHCHVMGTFDKWGHIRRCLGPVLIVGRAVFQRRGEYKGFESCLFFFFLLSCVLSSCLASNCRLMFFFYLTHLFPTVMGLKKIYTRGARALLLHCLCWVRGGCPGEHSECEYVQLFVLYSLVSCVRQHNVVQCIFSSLFTFSFSLKQDLVAASKKWQFEMLILLRWKVLQNRYPVFIFIWHGILKARRNKGTLRASFFFVIYLHSLDHLNKYVMFVL